MRKISSMLATILMASLLFAGTAQAETGTITDTGPDSQNDVLIKDSFKCEVKNTTEIDLENDNDQTAETGDAELNSNGSGGNATSGSASNSNKTQVGVEVTNGNVCFPTATTPPTLTPPVVPEGGRGAGQVSGASTVAQEAGGRGAGVQVAAPVGGVGAGTGGIALPVFVASLVSAALGAFRLRTPVNN